MFIRVQVTSNGQTTLVNPANITYIEDYDEEFKPEFNTQIHFPNTSIKVVNDKETVERRVDEMRQEMMEGMVPDLDIGSMGDMF